MGAAMGALLVSGGRFVATLETTAVFASTLVCFLLLAILGFVNVAIRKIGHKEKA